MGKRGPNGFHSGCGTHWDLVCPLGSEKTARIIFSLELNAGWLGDMTTLVATLVHHAATACHSGGVRYLW